MSIFEKTELGNGIRVVTAPFPQVGSVSCFVMLAAGSRYETPDAKGIAHFAEHMFFKGTERRPTARTISTEIDAIGGEFNAFTGKELTGYYVRCGSETRDTALDVLADMLLHSRFDEAEITKEKGVILEEMNVYLDTPQRYVGNVYDRLLYADQPLGWDIIGTRETVQDATRETFTTYLDTWYRPERMVVGIGGRIGDGLTERLEELLGGIEPRPTGHPTDVELPPDTSPVLVHKKDSEQAHLILGVRGYPIGHPNRYALQLLAVVLGGGMSSRLFTEVRERRGLGYYVHAGNTAYTDAGTFYASAGVDVARVDEAITTILGELRKIAAEPVPAEELEKARGYSKGRFVLRLESPQGTIQYGLRREVLEGEIEEPDELLRRLDEVTVEDVQRVARDLFEDKRLYLALVGPFDDPARFEAAAPACSLRCVIELLGVYRARLRQNRSLGVAMLHAGADVQASEQLGRPADRDRIRSGRSSDPNARSVTVSGGTRSIPPAPRCSRSSRSSFVPRLGAVSERELLRRTAEIAADFVETLDERSIWPPATVDELRGALGGPLPDDPSDPLDVIEALAAGAEPGIVGIPSGRYFGFVIGGALPAALAADWLTSAWDQNAGLVICGPSAAVCEDVAGEWLKDLLGLPETASFAFVTGCQMAHVTCLAAARHDVLERVGWDVESKGLAGSPPITVVAGDRKHVTVDRALRLLGLGSEGTLRVDVDAQGRMQSDALERALHDLTGPAIVCVQAGEVNTGSFDPIARSRGALSRRGCVAPRRRRVRPLGRRLARAEAPRLRRGACRLVGDRRAQVAERPVRQRPGVRRARGRPPRRDAPRGRVPRRERRRPRPDGLDAGVLAACPRVRRLCGAALARTVGRRRSRGAMRAREPGSSQRRWRTYRAARS